MTDRRRAAFYRPARASYVSGQTAVFRFRNVLRRSDRAGAMRRPQAFVCRQADRPACFSVATYRMVWHAEQPGCDCGTPPNQAPHVDGTGCARNPNA